MLKWFEAIEWQLYLSTRIHSTNHLATQKKYVVDDFFPSEYHLGTALLHFYRLSKAAEQDLGLSLDLDLGLGLDLDLGLGQQKSNSGCQCWTTQSDTTAEPKEPEENLPVAQKTSQIQTSGSKGQLCVCLCVCARVCECDWVGGCAFLIVLMSLLRA